MSIENLEKFMFKGIGKYDIPCINPIYDFNKCELIGLNQARNCRIPDKKGVHFFLDDYQINRVWEKPVAYIDLLRKFKYVLSPDFSLYRDIPLSVQIFNHYKKHWCGAYWQMHGINVIPTISWSDKRSYEFCFDGEPRNSVVAISSVGTQNSKESKELFEQGYNEMMNRLEPCLVLFVGWRNSMKFQGNIIPLPAFQNRFDNISYNPLQNQAERS